MHDALVIHRPAGAATQLVLLFHGVGSNAEDLRPLGTALADRFDQAWVVSVRAPEASDVGAGWQWFSVAGIGEGNRPPRVAAAMPRFVQAVRHRQQETGLNAAATTLFGFSQGAIMALEATQHSAPVAGRVVAIAGRFAQPPRVAPAGTLVHLMHGEQDRVMPVGLAVEAERQLRALGVQATLDLYPGLGHGIDGRVVDGIVRRLGGQVHRGSK
ncbi:MAG: esterase [Rhizobacter sp.]|nr:esterase [Rhizobacter sp.]